jgi:predicted nucleotidyltransferase
MYGSYAKGHPNPDSDIDVAVIVPEPEITDHWEQSADLWGDVFKVSTLIEPVLMEDNEDSMLYREVMRTGITV